MAIENLKKILILALSFSFFGYIYLYISTEKKFKHPSISLPTYLSHVSIELWRFFFKFWSNYGYWKFPETTLNFEFLFLAIYITSQKKGLAQKEGHPSP
jgi:hypothetical protein